MSEKILMTSSDIKRTLLRIAHEVVEKNRGTENLVLIGIQTRGVPLAKRLAGMIREFEEIAVTVGTLDIGLYRDDVSTNNLRPIIHDSDIPIDITGKQIILVDDVLYTGRSIRAAMDALMDTGRPKSIQLAVLIDRGHRELPIRADYTGKNIPTSQNEEIKIHFKETEGKDEVIITKRTQNP